MLCTVVRYGVLNLLIRNPQIIAYNQSIVKNLTMTAYNPSVVNNLAIITRAARPCPLAPLTANSNLAGREKNHELSEKGERTYEIKDFGRNLLPGGVLHSLS